MSAGVEQGVSRSQLLLTSKFQLSKAGAAFCSSAPRVQLGFVQLHVAQDLPEASL